MTALIPFVIALSLLQAEAGDSIKGPDIQPVQINSLELPSESEDEEKDEHDVSDEEEGRQGGHSEASEGAEATPLDSE